MRCIAILLLLASCATTDVMTGDPLGIPDGKADDNWWKPERGLAIAQPPFLIEPELGGHTVRGTFDPDVYAGVVFAAPSGTVIQTFTRTWLADSASSPWDTEPFLFRWIGDDWHDLEDWSKWELISHCCNNDTKTLRYTGQFMVAVMTTEPAYTAGADFLVFIPGAPTQTTVHGALRCGSERRPVGGATLSIDVSSEHVTSRADGTFAFGAMYPAGRHNVFVSVKGRSDLATFDAVLASDGGAIELVLDRCPT